MSTRIPPIYAVDVLYALTCLINYIVASTTQMKTSNYVAAACALFNNNTNNTYNNRKYGEYLTLERVYEASHHQRVARIL